MNKHQITRWCGICATERQFDIVEEGRSVARGSAHVEAWDSAHVEAWDSAHVVAWGSAHVVAWDSAHVVAWGSAHVEGQSPCAVLVVRSAYADARGGLLVVAYRQEPTAEAWLRATNARVDGDTAVLYKRTAADYSTQHGVRYVPGADVEAPDWDPLPECGGGLHFVAHPAQADQFRDGADDRYVACAVAIADIVVHEQPLHPDKVKAPRCRVLYECDREGKPVAVGTTSIPEVTA